MGVPIIDSLFLATDLPLDSRTVVSLPNDVSRYFYGGFVGFETTGDRPFWIDNSLNVNYFGIGDVSQVYVDGSLATRDGSINYLASYNIIQDASIFINAQEIIQLDSSIVNLDSSIASLESYINQTFLKESSLGPQFFFQDGSLFVTDIVGVSQAYVDGSLAARDVSISNNAISILNLQTDITRIDASLVDIDSSIQSLNNWNSSLDGSILRIDNYNVIQDASIQAIEASLGDYVKKSGDTMTGDLIINTDLSVNGKGTFGQFNVSGTAFPGSPSSGDRFYRTDLEQDFVYDSSRGRWLTPTRNTFSSGWNRSNAGNSQYLSIGNAVMDSVSGFKMFNDGVITNISVQNNIVVTGAGRSLEVRVNNSTTYKDTITITTGNTGAIKYSNIDVSAGDIIQVLTIPGSDRIDDIILNFEVAGRG